MQQVLWFSKNGSVTPLIFPIFGLVLLKKLSNIFRIFVQVLFWISSSQKIKLSKFEFLPKKNLPFSISCEIDSNTGFLLLFWLRPVEKYYFQKFSGKTPFRDITLTFKNSWNSNPLHLLKWIKMWSKALVGSLVKI